MPPKEKEERYDFSFDGVSGGEPYRARDRRVPVRFPAGPRHGGAAAGAPAMPGGAAGVKMIRLRVTRDTQKNADIIALFSDAPPAGAGYYFQNGQHCLQYLDANYDMALTQSELDDLDELWRIISIQRDIGIHEFTITQLAAYVRRINGNRPIANRKTNDQIAEKILQFIYKCSSHFYQSGVKEYNAPAGSREFEHPVGHPLAGQRDVVALTQSFQNQWKLAFDQRILTCTAPTRGGNETRQSVDAMRRVSINEGARPLKGKLRGSP
eukprot:2053667-Prymnesium_polylepis.1